MLLEDVAGRLGRAIGSDGAAFRLGGDEFCALVPGHWSASHGAILLPNEASDPAAALRLADERMYASKRRVVRSPGEADGS